MDKKYNIIIILAILIVFFVVIVYLRDINIEEKKVDISEEKIVVEKTCEEKCKTEDCLFGCYTVQMNIALAEKNPAKCNEIKTDSIKKLCISNVNSALKK